MYGNKKYIVTFLNELVVQVYQIEVKRSAPDKEKIFRRYREFDELQNKVMQCFPDTSLPQLPGKILIPGKSHTKQVRRCKRNRFFFFED